MPREEMPINFDQSRTQTPWDREAERQRAVSIARKLATADELERFEEEWDRQERRACDQ